MPRNPQQNQQMRLESRRKILSTAASLFSQKGFFNVRIAEIARQAGMSPGNIYWYFTSKEEVLKAIIGDFFAAYENMLIRAATLPGEARGKLIRLVELQIALSIEYGDYFSVCMSIMGHGGPAYLKTLGFDSVEIGMRYQNHLSAILEGAIQVGMLPKRDPQVLAVFFFSFFNGLMITYGTDWHKLPSSLIVQAALGLLGFEEASKG